MDTDVYWLYFYCTFMFSILWATNLLLIQGMVAIIQEKLWYKKYLYSMIDLSHLQERNIPAVFPYLEITCKKSVS